MPAVMRPRVLQHAKLVVLVIFFIPQVFLQLSMELAVAALGGFAAPEKRYVKFFYINPAFRGRGHDVLSCCVNEFISAATPRVASPRGT